MPTELRLRDPCYKEIHIGDSAKVTSPRFAGGKRDSDESSDLSENQSAGVGGAQSGPLNVKPNLLLPQNVLSTTPTATCPEAGPKSGGPHYSTAILRKENP